jgi:hypothetical protein
VTTRTLVLSCLAGVVLVACGQSVRRFAAREPMAVDPDTTPFLPKPKARKAAQIWDTIDNTVFRPLVETLAIHQARRARNVNALDEVPNSSWFENRIDQVTGDTAAFVRGACEGELPDPKGPWTVVSGKPDGANPGFQVKHANGKRYFFKPDNKQGGGRQSTADLFGTRVHHAAGYFTACTHVIYVHPSAIQIAPDAKAENFVGEKEPFTKEKLQKVLDYGIKNDAGELRAGLSQFLPGKPLGPWADFGLRDDDPNDVIPHEDRRELRGTYIFGAWLSHYDAREQNSMDMWQAPADDAPGYIKHFQLDFGDCLGSMSAWDRVSRRRGHAYEIDWPYVFVELFTLGLLPRPWRDPEKTPGGNLGYYKTEDFQPDRYRTAYPFGPYARVTEADAAWGARILARITPEMVRALVAAAQLPDPVTERELERALLGRREALLRRFLGKLSPLARPRLDSGKLCVVDARVEGGVPGAGVVTARQDGATLTVERGAAPGESCITLGAVRDYSIVELRADTTQPLRVHLYQHEGRYKVAGLDRE